VAHAGGEARKEVGWRGGLAVSISPPAGNRPADLDGARVPHSGADMLEGGVRWGGLPVAVPAPTLHDTEQRDSAIVIRPHTETLK
jgi:hypothetical protein